MSTFNNFYNDLPYTGRSDYFGSISYSKGFGPALTIRMVPIRDMSIDYADKTTNYDKLVSNVTNYLPKGTSVTAIIKDSKTNKSNGKLIDGQVDTIDFDFENQLLHIYVIDPSSGERKEVYPESIFRKTERMPYYIETERNI